MSIGTFYRKKKIFQNQHLSNIFGEQTKFFEILFQRVCQKRKMQVRKSFLGHFFKVILLIFFGPWPKVSRGFVRKISASMSKLDSQFQKKHSGEFVFLCKNYKLLLSFENRAETFRLTVGKRSAGLSSCFLLPHWNILKKKFWKVFAFFVDFFRINSGNWAGNVWPARQNCILRIYRNVFWKKNCFGKQRKIFIIFRHWAEVFDTMSIFWRVG